MTLFSSQSIWLVIAIIAAVVFVLFVRAMLERSAWTAGHSSQVVTSSADYVPSDAELGEQPWPDLPEPEATASPDTGVSSTPVPAAVVYRCVGTGGAVAFQSEPCADAQRTTRIIEAVPEPERPPQRVVSASVNQYGYTSRSSDARDQQRARCNAARQQREQTLERVGLARTYDLLRQLDETVYEACKGL